MIPYVAIDIETTGLDPDRHKVVQFVDNGKPLIELPIFNEYLKQQYVEIDSDPTLGK